MAKASAPCRERGAYLGENRRKHAPSRIVEALAVAVGRHFGIRTAGIAFVVGVAVVAVKWPSGSTCQLAGSSPKSAYFASTSVPVVLAVSSRLQSLDEVWTEICGAPQ